MELEDAQMKRRVMSSTGARNLHLSVVSMKHEREKHNKWLPTKRCFDHYGPVRKRNNKGSSGENKRGAVGLGILLNETQCKDSLKMGLPEEGYSTRRHSNPIHPSPNAWF